MKTIVGGKEVIFSEAFYIPKEQDLEILACFDDLGEPDEVPLKFEFVTRDNDGEPKVDLEYSIEEGRGVVRIVNPSGGFIVPDGLPAEIAKSNSGRQIYMVFAVQVFKNYYRAHVQLTIEIAADES